MVEGSINILQDTSLQTSIGFTTTHCVCLTSTCLAVCEYASIVTFGGSIKQNEEQEEEYVYLTNLEAKIKRLVFRQCGRCLLRMNALERYDRSWSSSNLASQCLSSPVFLFFSIKKEQPISQLVCNKFKHKCLKYLSLSCPFNQEKWIQTWSILRHDVAPSLTSLALIGLILKSTYMFSSTSSLSISNPILLSFLLFSFWIFVKNNHVILSQMSVLKKLN